MRRAGLFQWIAPVETLGTMALVLDRYDYKSTPAYTFTRRIDPATGMFAGNIIDARQRIQTRTVPTFVRVFGHCARGDKFSHRYSADVPAPGASNLYLGDPEITLGRIADPHPVQRRYVKSERARTFEESNQEADRLMAKSLTDFRVYTVTVQGHSQGEDEARRLYAANTTATVVDELFELSEKMFVHRVAFRGRRKGGTTTTLTLIPLNVVQLTVGVTEPT